MTNMLIDFVCRYVLVAMWFEVIWGLLELLLQATHPFLCGVGHISTTLLTMMVMFTGSNNHLIIYTGNGGN